MPQPSFGVTVPTNEGGFPDTPSIDWPPIHQLARQVERLGFDSLWLCDHLMYRYGSVEIGLMECWTTLSALAVVTERVQLGTLVLSQAFRNPGLLGRMGATADLISNGRLIVGLGAGWNEVENNAFGFPFDPPGARVDRLREVVTIVRDLLTQEHVHFHGNDYRIENALSRPQPRQRPRPPVWVAAFGNRMLRLTAELADGWNIAWGITPEQFRAITAKFDAICGEVGRDPSQITRSLGIHTLIAPTWRELEQIYRHLPVGLTRRRAIDTGLDLRTFAQDKLIGTPAEVFERAVGLVEAGVQHFILNFGSVPFEIVSTEMIDLFGREVLPELRSACCKG